MKFKSHMEQEEQACNKKHKKEPSCIVLEDLSHQMEDIQPLKHKEWRHMTIYQLLIHHNPADREPETDILVG